MILAFDYREHAHFIRTVLLGYVTYLFLGISNYVLHVATTFVSSFGDHINWIVPCFQKSVSGHSYGLDVERLLFRLKAGI